ncbi:DUF4244 domain-containing protein [Arthrobacter sp. zg-Y820]|uniref:DUF4244 domain-containing protein n=1 Tax=unclassified Arthrobacter TaxID=235627 RepID=UPI001E30A7DC|nr:MULTISPECIES: DUF4244 domain-containing protein [unclassified Arthrobacter]MCC9196966.1 DUF4244 domain-containing protein [Arthrobacter sp. zg-Y820]MDK1279831.1 DUF4244 domain-containing protein [Arthrobacter sp. zg.Y820]WIB09138.1 DUF4244 domain-containing protein [Arthrobacter sp. zg-Y820]
MSVLSKSITTAQPGRSFAGAPLFSAEGAPGPAADGAPCGCNATDSSLPQPSAVRSGRGPGTVTVLYPKLEADPKLDPAARDRAARDSAARGRASRADRRRRNFSDREAGMATAEYAIATLAAVAFAALLVAVLGSGEVRSLLMGLIRSALTLG